MSQHVISRGMTLVTIPGERAHPVRAQVARLVSNIVAVGGQHAAFAGDEVLVAEKGKAPNVAEGADRGRTMETTDHRTTGARGRGERGEGTWKMGERRGEMDTGADGVAGVFNE